METLPPEIIACIGDFCTTLALNRLAQTSSYLCSTLNPHLYKRNLRKSPYEEKPCVTWAIKYSSLETLKRAVSFGIDLDSSVRRTVPGEATSTELGSALHYAVRLGRKEIVRYMLDNGVDPKYRFSDLPCGCQLRHTRIYPLHTAIVHSGDQEMAGWLISKGAHFSMVGVPALFECCTSPNEGLFYQLLDMGADVLALDSRGNTLLHRAATVEASLKIATELLDRGIRVNHRNSPPERKTALGRLRFSDQLFEHEYDMARLLISRGADPLLDLVSGEPSILWNCMFPKEQLDPTSSNHKFQQVQRPIRGLVKALLDFEFSDPKRNIDPWDLSNVMGHGTLVQAATSLRDAECVKIILDATVKASATLMRQDRIVDPVGIQQSVLASLIKADLQFFQDFMDDFSQLPEAVSPASRISVLLDYGARLDRVGHYGSEISALQVALYAACSTSYKRPDSSSAAIPGNVFYLRFLCARAGRNNISKDHLDEQIDKYTILQASKGEEDDGILRESLEMLLDLRARLY